MENQIPTATEITELSNGGHSARINGGPIQSGFREGTDASGRGYAAIMQAIEDGAEVTPYVPHVDAYAELRRPLYSPTGDQLDIIWKQLNQLRLEGNPLIQEADDELGKILAIKKLHPKEEEV